MAAWVSCAGQQHFNGVFDMINRSEVARALAKAIAYKQCGQHVKAAAWARELVKLLECAQILVSDAEYDTEELELGGVR